MKRPNIPLVKDLDGKHRGEDIVVVGTAWYIRDLDLHMLDGITTISCNRILRHPYFRPTCLMVSDRRPYMIEMEAGRYEEYADQVQLMFSTSIFDPKIKCHGTAPQPIPKFPWIPWRARGSSSAMNWETLSESLNSFANIGGPMLQAAVIMGARRIGITGLGIVRPGPGGNHFYKQKDPWSRGKGNPPNTERCYRRAKDDLDRMGIEVCNLTLENELLEDIFGVYDFAQFVREAKR